MGDEKARFLQVRNWDKFQICDRDAPWIRLYTALIQNYDFLSQSDANKALIPCIWMYAGRNGNRIPNDPSFLKSIFFITGDVDLDGLCACNFLEPFDESHYMQVQDARNVAIRNRLEKDRRKKRSESENKNSESENANSDSPDTDTDTDTESELDADVDSFGKHNIGAKANGNGHSKPARKRKPKSDVELTPEQSVWFDEFWNVYRQANGGSKQPARVSYAKKVKTHDVHRSILAALKWQIPHWREETKRWNYTPKLASTYLNNDGWTDDPPVKQPAPEGVFRGDEEMTF